MFNSNKSSVVSKESQTFYCQKSENSSERLKGIFVNVDDGYKVSAQQSPVPNETPSVT